MAIDKSRNKNGTTTYRVRIWYKSRIVNTGYFNRAEDARKWESIQKTAIQERKYFKKRVSDCLFDQLFKEWMIYHAEINKAPSSVIDDRGMYRNYLDPYIGRLKLSEICTEDIEKMVNDLIKEGRLSNKTINKILQLTKAVFNFGVRRKRLEFNPASCIKLLPLGTLNFKYWSQEEASVFLKYTNIKYQNNRRPFLFYLLALSTGLRAGEMLGLSWSSVDFGRNLLIISHIYDRVTKSIRNSTKGKKIRYVGMNENLKEELLSLKNLYPDSTYVFENENNKNWDQDNFRHRFFYKDVKESGVKLIRIHDLRHTFASHYVMNGGTIFDLQQILGHSDTKTTMRYSHLSPSHIAHTASIVKFDFKDKKNVINFESKVQNGAC